MSAANTEPTESGDTSADYVCLGNFDPLVARRIIERFVQHEVRYEARDASSIEMAGAGIGDYDAPATRYPVRARINRVRLWVSPHDQQKAQGLVEEV